MHALLIGETWLKSSLPSALYSLPGYRLIRCDRVGRTGGGVAMYLREDLSHKVIYGTQSGSQLECLFVEVSFSHSKVLLGVVYSPPNSNYFEEFQGIIELLLPNYNHHIVLGDFNTCLNRGDSRSDRLMSILNASNLCTLPLRPTHYTPYLNSFTLLDLIITSEPSLAVSHGQLNADQFSAHDLIYLTYKLKSPKFKPKIKSFRRFDLIDVDRLRVEADGIDWSAVFLSSDVNQMVTCFNTSITDLYDKHAPVQTRAVRRAPAPWLTEDIRSLMKRRNRAKVKARQTGLPCDQEKYIFLRNRCSRACRRSKQDYFSQNIDLSNVKRTWRFLRQQGVGKPVDADDAVQIDLNILNQHFAAVPAVLTDGVKLSTCADIEASRPVGAESFVFSEVSMSDVSRAFRDIKSTAVGCDGISSRMLGPIMSSVLPVITFIINASLSSSEFPSAWKEANVIPLPKKAAPASPSDFRPISVLPLLSKVAEKLVFQQLNSFIVAHSLYNPLQSGFRRGHSTTTALIKITDDIREAMDDTQLTVLVLLDFSSAFNCVDFDLLLSRLRALNLSDEVVDWFGSYLFMRRQKVICDGAGSDWVQLVAGVPQGGILSPLLFSLFIGSISQNIRGPFHLYADDLQIYTHFSPQDVVESFALMNENLQYIASWCERNGLLINPAKSQAIIIGSPRLLTSLNRNSLPCLFLNNQLIPFSDDVKDLGIYIDCKLSWKKQVDELSRKVFSSLHALRRLQNFLSPDIKKILVQSLLHPLFDYADICYLDMAVEVASRLERLQNMCIRYIFSLRKYDHISEYRHQLQWKTMRERRDLHTLCLLYKILHNPSSPNYLKQRFTFLSSHQRSLRSDQNNLLLIPSHRSKFYSESFTVRAARLWNQLPLSIRGSQTIFTFKKSLTGI
jgi:hypothetical protein